MSSRSQIQIKAEQKRSFAHVPTGFLQRKKRPGCMKDENRVSRQAIERKSANYSESSEVPPIVHEVLRSPGQPLDLATRTFMESRFGHDFGQVRVHTTRDQSSQSNSAAGYPGDHYEQAVDQVGMCAVQMQVENTKCEPVPLSYSRDGLEDEEGEESVNLQAPPVTQPSTQPQPAPSCPASVRVDNVTNLTQAGLQAGFLSAYGIIARMRVLPDSRTWDGKHVTESLMQISNTCPSGLTRPGPCNGNSTFTVGAASGRSVLIPQQPAMRNRFYDFHASRSRNISFLHDPNRNPTGMNSCEAVCLQRYSCNGIVIGTHTVKRQYHKGTFNGRNVTIISVTKQDLVSEPGDFPVRTLPLGLEYA